jgi:hypothetical protein
VWEADGRTVLVFSHPNHELAIFGIVQRVRPRLVFLTDGGGERRVAETCRALGELNLGLLEQCTFLNYAENEFYAHLVDGNHSFWREVVGGLATALEDAAPTRVACDAVEFYNPVHDVSLPLVRAALDRAGLPCPVFEVPLVHQQLAPTERYVVQRFPSHRSAAALAVALTAEELARKLRALEETYTCLTEQMGSVLRSVPREQLAREEIAPARSGLVPPGEDCVLRYEWRGRQLRQEGAVAEDIKYAQHYAPVARTLLAMAGDRSMPA